MLAINTACDMHDKPILPRESRWQQLMQLLIVLLFSAFAHVHAADEPSDLNAVVITATRTAQPSFELPISIDRIDRGRIQDGQWQVNLSESLAQVAGASVQNRQNYAQDLQISIRGFGARSSFGTRGIRLIADGIPGTMPDGQGQFSQFDLGSADHIEVLRGPFSALYGNSAGGVIALTTEAGPSPSEVTGSFAAGSFGTDRVALKVAGQHRAINYVISAAHFQTDGYRQHSRAERNNFNAKLRVDLNDKATLTLLLNAVQTPFVQDPLGLTQAQLTTPEQAGANALLYNTRKSLAQENLGVRYEYELTADNELSAMLYAGHRATTQYQAILASAQAASTHPGGVIDLTRHYGGLDLRFTHRQLLIDAPLELTAGINFDDLNEDRAGYLNFSGSSVGVLGAKRRDEANHIYNLDQYLQAQWDPLARWRLSAGVRNSLVRVTSRNRFNAGANNGVMPTSSVHYAATTPVAGVTYRATDHLHWYGAYGRGFETPTLNEVAYRSTDGSVPGLNSLKPARSSNYEVGVKYKQPHISANLAAFHIDTRNELAVLSSAGGRTVYQNVAATQRRGMELSIESNMGSIDSTVAYTMLRAQVSRAYTSCIGLPCVLTAVAAGNQLPAVPKNSLYAAVTWRGDRHGLAITGETVRRSRLYANDTNTQSAEGYWLANLQFRWKKTIGAWRLSAAGRIDNVTDQRYVGSVIVNDGNGRFFEPEPGRTFSLMVSVVR